MKNILAILLFFSTTVSAQVDLNLGLRAYYPFSGNASDASGNNNHVLFNSASLTTDRYGTPNSAYQFNGNNYMRIPHSSSLNFGNQLTLCAWVKVSGFYTGVCHENAIISRGDNDNTPGGFFLRFSDKIYSNDQNCTLPVDESHETFYGPATTSPVVNPLPYVQKERWYSLVWVSDGTTLKMYVNCQLVLQGTATGFFSTTSDIYFGTMNNFVYPDWFTGTMDEIRIYNRALNIDEINAYGGCNGSPSDLTCSQFYTTTQVAAGGTINEVMIIRNVGTGATTQPMSFNVTNYSALTGLTITPIPAGTNITIGFSTYTISGGWTFNPGSGTFTCSNLVLPGGSNTFGLYISRGTAPATGANGMVTQTTTLPPGAGGESTFSNNTLSNSLLKNGP